MATYNIPPMLQRNDEEGMPVFSSGPQIPTQELFTSQPAYGYQGPIDTESTYQEAQSMPYFSDGLGWKVANSDGTSTNIVTGETEIDGTNPKEKQESGSGIADAHANGDLKAYTDQVMVRAGLKKRDYEYDLVDQKDGWLPALSQFAITGLGAYIAKKRGASDKSIGTMLSTSLIQGGKHLKGIQNQIQRQDKIDYMEASGYLGEDIQAWLKSGDEKDLYETLKNRPFAEDKGKQTAYYEKGAKLPNGDIAKSTGNYTTHYTYTMDGTPQVAHISYDGDSIGIQNDKAIELEKLKHGFRLAEQEHQQEIDQGSPKVVSPGSILVDHEGNVLRENTHLTPAEIAAQQKQAENQAELVDSARTEYQTSTQTIQAVQQVSENDIANVAGIKDVLTPDVFNSLDVNRRQAVQNLNQVIGNTYMSAREALKGGGAIANEEAARANIAYTNIVDVETGQVKTGLKPEFYKAELAKLEKTARYSQAYSNFVRTNSRRPSPQEEQTIYNSIYGSDSGSETRTTASGVTYTIKK